MCDTEKNPLRCVVLVGEVGRAVSCSIYTQRSSACREFEAGTEACNKARALHVYYTCKFINVCIGLVAYF